MAQKNQIKKEKWQWLKVVLGFGYLKEVLAPFCDDIANQQHKDILDNIKRTKNVSSVICSTCSLKTLQPDHVKIGKKTCRYSLVNCNCKTSGKTACPNNVCGAIYDSIITYHASTPPVPYWKNTQTQQWITNPWSIAKCFINAQGYKHTASAADTDCTGLLHVIINNTFFHNHVSCNMTGQNIFTKVRQYRNEVYHSSSQVLDRQKTNFYIDEMIAVLQDSKELNNRTDAHEAVETLKDLKNEDYIIPMEHLEKVLGDIREEMRLNKKTKEDLHRRFSTLESELKQEMKILKNVFAQKKTDYNKLKADLREKLIKEYRQTLLHMPTMPCQTEHLCNVKDVYVTPRITIKSKDKDRQEIETDVKTMSDIFIKDGQPLKSIYVLGEAGSGKSSFCKSLVQCWCMAHSDKQHLKGQSVKRRKVKGLITEDLSNEIKEIKNFDFLFCLPLRNCTEKIVIKDMLEEEYEHPVLKELLERESDKCLILLDGLDEWTHISKCPPKRAKFSNYTVLTTSRPWKLGTLGISDNEMQQMFHINGFGVKSKKNMIEKTVKVLNETFRTVKDPLSCEDALENETFESLTHTAMMLQQLICMWFDDRLIETSKCHLYTCILDLFFVWYKKKDPDVSLFNEELNKAHGHELPKLFNKTEECKSQSYVIQCLSRLAYNTLIMNKKETSLTFDSSMFQKFDIPYNIKIFCLELGILSEEKGPSLSASRSRKSHISFIHKSVQEYLAAIYIVGKTKTEQESSLDMESADLSDYLSQILNVKTVDELLEQENILIMMCGLEPRLAASISKFIYDIATRDERVVMYRTSINDRHLHFLLILCIQNMILNCIEETKASNKNHQFCFYLMDLIFVDNEDAARLFTCAEKQNITLDSVISFNADLSLNEGELDDSRIFECMIKCKRIDSITIVCNTTELYERSWDIIERNAPRLKMLSVKLDLKSALHTPSFRRFANINNLVALEVEDFTVTHENFTSLCTFLSGSGNLQQISIRIQCECQQQHEVDLSKHKQLQYLRYDKPVVVTNVGCTHLEVIQCLSLNQINCIKGLELFLTLSIKLKSIFMSYDSISEEENLTHSSDAPNFSSTVTNILITFLPSLKNLRNLNMYHFTFTDNIINCPSQMKSLETINLTGGTMSLTTWRKIVDSVASLPKPVEVEAWNMCITRDGEECNPVIDSWGIRRGGEEAVAIQYVCEREALFDVSYDFTNTIVFSTKK